VKLDKHYTLKDFIAEKLHKGDKLIVYKGECMQAIYYSSSEIPEKFLHENVIEAQDKGAGYIKVRICR
jgi:hypothetical protein